MDLSLLPLVGPIPRSLRTFAAEKQMTLYQTFAGYASLLAQHLPPSHDNAAAIPDQQQQERFHHFFFVLSKVSLDDRQPADISHRLSRIFITVHVPGTTWLARLLLESLKEACIMDAKQLVANFTAFSPVFGILLEGLLLDQIGAGTLTKAYIIFSDSPSEEQDRYLPKAKDDGSSPFGLTEEHHLLSLRGPLPIPPSRPCIFIHLEPNFPTIDGAIITPTEVILLQITVASRHNMTTSGLRRLQAFEKEFPSSCPRDWTLLFIVPQASPGDKLVTATPTKTLQRYAQNKLGIELQVGLMRVALEGRAKVRLTRARELWNLIVVFLQRYEVAWSEVSQIFDFENVEDVEMDVEG